MNFMKKIIVYILFLVNLIPVISYAETISWKVVNRFPLFKNDDDFKKIEDILKDSKTTSSEFLSVNLQSNKALRDLLPIENTAWDRKAEKYDNSILFKQSHEVEFVIQEGSKSGECLWNINKVEQKKLCNEPVYADINEKEPINVYIQSDNGSYTLNDKDGVQTKLIVALGDSFASGEGNPDYPTIFKDTPISDNWYLRKNIDVIDKSAEWWDRTCHRSLLSWQSLYALRDSVGDNDKHKVVQFASFACSGAEIYDGFFNPQKDPPGGKYTNHNTVLDSQHNAMMNLLCTGRVTTSKKTFRSGYEKTFQAGQIQGHGDNIQKRILGPAGQPYFGEIKNYAKCEGGTRKIDQVLLSFGGNDVGFSGVVTWGIGVHDPNNNAGGILKGFRKAGIHFVNSLVLNPISPTKAKKSFTQLNFLFKDLYDSFKEFNVDSSMVTALIYPDPLPKDDYSGCQLRSRQGNIPLSLIKNRTGGKWKFGLNEQDANSIRRDFILPFRIKLQDTITKITMKGGHSWEFLDANLAFNQGKDSHTLCSISKSCNLKGCDSGNKLTWVNNLGILNIDTSSYIPRISSFNEFYAYDSSRSRGLRLASDVFLTQSIVKNNKLNDDWVNGIAHPTANMHAVLADKLFELQKSMSKEL